MLGEDLYHSISEKIELEISKHGVLTLKLVKLDPRKNSDKEKSRRNTGRRTNMDKLEAMLTLLRSDSLATDFAKFIEFLRSLSIYRAFK